MRRIRPATSSTPSPASSTPQLFDTVSRSVLPSSCSASISTCGMPHRPKPPTASEAPSPMSATASAADATTLSTLASLSCSAGSGPALDRLSRDSSAAAPTGLSG